MSGWIWAMCKYAALDAKRRRTKEVASETVSNLTALFRLAKAEREDMPVSLVAQVRLSFAEEERTIIDLRLLKGLTLTQVGEKMGVAEGTIRYRLSNIIRDFRKKLDEMQDGGRA